MKRWQDITVMNACDCCFYQRKMPWRFLVYSCSHSCDQRDCCHFFFERRLVYACDCCFCQRNGGSRNKLSMPISTICCQSMVATTNRIASVFVFWRTLMTADTHCSCRCVYLQSRIVRVAQKQMIKYGCMKRWQKHNNNVCVWLLLVLTQRCHDVP